MTTGPTYDPARTGLLFVDPYNDFLSEGGKLWRRVKEVAEQVGLIDNLKAIVKTSREKSIQVFIVPHLSELMRSKSTRCESVTRHSRKSHSPMTTAPGMSRAAS